MLNGSYNVFLKIIILSIWCNRICWHTLMLKKLILFQILYIIVGPLCPAALKCFVFYKAPPSDKHSLLWLANWPRAQARVGNVTVMMLVCVCKHAMVVSPSLTHESTHTHTHTRDAQNSTFEQSIANIKLNKT